MYYGMSKGTSQAEATSNNKKKSRNPLSSYACLKASGSKYKIPLNKFVATFESISKF